MSLERIVQLHACYGGNVDGKYRPRKADQFHPAGLGDKTAAELYDILEPDEFPQHATFDDGSPIPDTYIKQIQTRGLELAVDVPWRPGDLMLIDNVLVAHGRRPFDGARRVLVAMSD
jgi:hypothetical protein